MLMLVASVSHVSRHSAGVSVEALRRVDSERGGHDGGSRTLFHRGVTREYFDR